MDKRWTPTPLPAEDQSSGLSQKLNVSKVISDLLLQRGINDFESAKSFFRPNIGQLYSPFLMKGMDAAVRCLGMALEQQKKIMVYGDYDVDGTSAVALVYGFLKKYHNNIEFYIPDRYGEGYGVSHQGMSYAIDQGVDLLITLDCGIKAVETLKIATDAGIDVIICDHHFPGNELPIATAILNPKQKDCAYPFKELCGCGVGFKLLQGLVEKYNLEEEVLWAQLDLVAIATAADIVPIVDENRTLTALGLSVINSDPRPGIQALFEAAGNKKEIGVGDLVFTVAPRINAAGRIEHGKEAVKLLSRDEMDEATNLAKNLHVLNMERRQLDQEMAAEALEQILARGLGEKNTTVVYDPSWHKGVVGIVASRLTETYYRPTVVLCKSDDKITGSVRSVKGFDVHDALCECSDYLEQFGGHKYAAGLTMKADRLDAFSQKFEEVVSRKIPKELLIPEIEYDHELHLSQITGKFYNVLKQMAPFGPGNLAPLFLFKEVFVQGRSRILGGKHLKFNVTQSGTESIHFPCIAFGMAEKLQFIENQKPFQMLASIEENHWNGRVELQLVVKDIKPEF
ncbi:single-stranded-DNA-specific exonuclease RecJ [Luteibaculum oceani]|uniref:Single-stranded-DNA-specific exonuclease RecJ n=1 Tax=Luteibaculum oceani TaxID=1294296 RepID=A0A5C6VL74_9FLAO|nr:single-stranded-DNA-specific exonuclease RecJ [Luteibaculum oceani]TXC85116.1 single-stranded-DNA-specific exonuclease RecJ [Luteibaculum oceani]